MAVVPQLEEDVVDCQYPGFIEAMFCDVSFSPQGCLTSS